PGGEPVEEAEVTLVLDNQSKIFSELCPEPQVIISRRITKNSSTYRIQGRLAAAREVENLLTLAHIDPNGYHIVEQGTVTDVLEGSARRRREILEEVAGIAAYEERKAKAVEELGQVKERLNTGRIVLAERRARLAELFRQREAALAFQTLSAERERIQATLIFRRYEAKREALEKALIQAERLREEVEALAQEVDQLDRAIEERERTQATLSPSPQEDLTDLIKTVERLRAELSGKEAALKLLDREIGTLRQTLADLARISPERGKPPEAVSAVLRLGWDGIVGTLGELVHPREGFEQALATALGNHAHDIVVSTRDLALQCVRYLKENGLGRARFLPLDKLFLSPPSAQAQAAKRLPGVHGFLVDFVDCPPEVRPALLYVLGDTLVADSLEVVRTTEGVRVVTLDGDLLERGGAIVGGSIKRGRDPGLSLRQEELRRREEERAQLASQIERISLALNQAEEELSRRAQERQELQAARAREEGELFALRERRREIYRELERKRANLARYEREAAELRGELSALGEVQPPAQPLQGAPEVLQARLRQIERELAALGAVNLRAIEEYETALAEVQELKERVNTLEREKEEIERFIAEIERKKREKFLETVENVSAELNRLFVRLFGGGEARLVLAEPGNISSDLLVQVRLPGKELRVLDALSGGEKTLVAIAFVLALAAGRPAPFYLLDEVDAALDQANSERLARLLREFAKSAQVIVVSHNEELVRHADRIYGVVLRNGASEIVGMELVPHA
ncbi:MAG: chromosome segregation protein SMC, partial [Candidatus Bipolaricaulota bacterium]|nr:chromosome segregation protein SMC [Candidatus Bipolaricaulota bacterium]MDW8126968.1 chromosome segregation SMC family protein [Candidatus Bipolaricaulota bacterium]